MNTGIRTLIFSFYFGLLVSLSPLSEAAAQVAPQTFTNLKWATTWVTWPTHDLWLMVCPGGVPTLDVDLTMGTGSDNGMLYGRIICSYQDQLAYGAARILDISAYFTLYDQAGYSLWCNIPSLPTSLNGSCTVRLDFGLASGDPMIGTVILTYQP